MNDIITQITPALNTVLIATLVAILGYVGNKAAKLVPTILDFVVAKIGLANYTKLKFTATDIFYKIEEDGRLNKLVNSKISTFENLIKAKFPAITDKDIDTLRQAIAGEFNGNKHIIEKELLAPLENATPIIKYYASDGVTELTPVINITQ